MQKKMQDKKRMTLDIAADIFEAHIEAATDSYTKIKR